MTSFMRNATKQSQRLHLCQTGLPVELWKIQTFTSSQLVKRTLIIHAYYSLSKLQNLQKPDIGTEQQDSVIEALLYKSTQPRISAGNEGIGLMLYVEGAIF
jgi:hypothetical protein